MCLQKQHAHRRSRTRLNQTDRSCCATFTRKVASYFCQTRYRKTKKSNIFFLKKAASAAIGRRRSNCRLFFKLSLTEAQVTKCAPHTASSHTSVSNTTEDCQNQLSQFQMCQFTQSLIKITQKKMETSEPRGSYRSIMLLHYTSDPNAEKIGRKKSHLVKLSSKLCASPVLRIQF